MIDEQHKFRAQIAIQSLLSTGCIVFGASVIAILVYANFFHVAPFTKAEVKHVAAPVLVVVKAPEVVTVTEPAIPVVEEIQIDSSAKMEVEADHTYTTFPDQTETAGIKVDKKVDIKPAKTIAVKTPVKNIPAFRNEVSYKNAFGKKVGLS
jgi:hypothetical protein